MNVVAGKTHRRSDSDGHYATECVLFADELGWKRREIWDCWQWCALMIECEMRCPRDVAEWCAMQMTRAMFDKVGGDAN